MRALLCLLFAFVVSCQTDKTPSNKNLPLDETPPAQLRIGSAPYLAPEKLQEIFDPLLVYLSQKTGVKTSLVLAKNYAELVRMLEDKEIEIAIFPPYVYTSAKDKIKTLQPLLSPITAGAETSGSYLFTTKDSGLKSIQDLKGKTMAFVDPESVTGYFFPVMAMLDAGLKPKQDLGKIVFLGSHDKVLTAVKNHEVDAGASYTSAMSAYTIREELEPDFFLILAKGPRSPHEVWAQSGSLTPGFSEKLRQLLFSLSSSTPEGKQILTLFNGFVPVEDANYEAIRSIAKRVKAEMGEL
jgi:phosphonate transport system substrate-binding protein